MNFLLLFPRVSFTLLLPLFEFLLVFSENQLVLLIIPFLWLFGCKLVIIQMKWTDISPINCAHFRNNQFNFLIK